MIVIKILECSSKGDKRFSAMYAKVSGFGKIDTIENHYQRCKRDSNGNAVSKGKPVDHILLNGIRLEPRFLTQWYNLLWIKYLDSSPTLVGVLKQYDEYNDFFKGKAVNCQADTIRNYMQNRTLLLESCSELVNILKSNYS